jgi:hypothetical protein
MTHKPIHIYWHVYPSNTGRDIMEDQADLLVSSGLYEACQSLTIGIIAGKKIFTRAKKTLLKILSDNKSNDKIVFLRSGKNVGEYLTLRKIYEDCVDPAIWNPDAKPDQTSQAKAHDSDDYILYFHTKSASIDVNKDPIWFWHKFMWRKAMEFFTIQNWQQCISVMNKDKSIGLCGAFVRSKNLNDYTESEKKCYEKRQSVYGKIHKITHIRRSTRISGSFWWSRCDHIQNIPLKYYKNLLPLNELGEQSRLSHEQFVMKSSLPYYAYSCCDNRHFNNLRTAYGRKLLYIQKVFNDIWFNMFKIEE